jgi:hypothetical protein
MVSASAVCMVGLSAVQTQPQALLSRSAAITMF